MIQLYTILNMSDSDNYFSDSDKSVKDEEIYPGIENEQEYSDDEMDDETRQIIYNSLMKKKDTIIDSFSRSDNVPILKKKRNKERNPRNSGQSLSDFQKKLDDSKPKKWKSKRSQDKKTDLGIVENNFSNRRQFSPRLPLPTYKTFKKYSEDKSVLTNSEEAFPSLTDTFKDITV